MAVSPRPHVHRRPTRRGALPPVALAGLAAAAVLALFCLVPAARASREATRTRLSHRLTDARSIGLPAPELDRLELRAGDRVELTWASLAGRAEELELVFSLDDGRHYDVRVSPRLSGGEARFVWRVPNVGVTGARVRLRARIDGREQSGPLSAAFSIAADPARESGLWAYREGDWWEDAGGEPFDRLGHLRPVPGPSIRAQAETFAAALPPRASTGGTPIRIVSSPLDGRHAFLSTALTTRHTPNTFRPTRE